MKRADKLRAFLKQRIEVAKTMEKKGVRTGVIESQHYDDSNTPVAYVAAIHEYGGTFNVPARQSTVYRKIDEKTGEWSKKHGSRFVSKNKSNFAKDVVIPAHTIHIPPRPFFRPTIENQKSAWIKTAKQAMNAGLSGDEVLKAIGQQAEGDVRETISNLTDPPLAQSTIRARNSQYKSKSGNKSTKPLVDTGLLKSSITSAVVDKEE